MDLYFQVKQLFTKQPFDRQRIRQAIKLRDQATGQERRLIGQMFESQCAIAPSLDDVTWLTRELSKSPRPQSGATG